MWDTLLNITSFIFKFQIINWWNQWAAWFKYEIGKFVLHVIIIANGQDIFLLCTEIDEWLEIPFLALINQKSLQVLRFRFHHLSELEDPVHSYMSINKKYIQFA